MRGDRKPFLLFAVSVGYTGFFAVWLVLRLLFFDRFWPLALINTFAEYFFVPLPLLVLVVVLYRKWRWLTPLALPAVAFVAMFGELFLPSRPAKPGSSDFTLTITTFNVLWENTNYSAIADVIEQNSPDIIGMQELHPNNFDGIEAALKTNYPYYAPEPGAPSGGVGLFSRYPIESAEPFPLPPRDLTLHAIVNVNGSRIHVFVVHLSANNFFGYPADQWLALVAERYASRASETAQLKSIIESMAEPVIMLCDCNLTDTSQAYATLSSFLIDSQRETGWGFGHTLIHPPNLVRTQRLDYIWHNSAFTAISIRVGSQGGSDHLPVTAELSLKGQP